MYLRKLLGDDVPLIMISDEGELLTLIKDNKYLVVKLSNSYLNSDYLDVTDAIDDRDKSSGWKVIDFDNDEVNIFDGEIPDEFITVGELVVRLK